eukprot:7666261-Pyramimonas_sp.AAC.1
MRRERALAPSNIARAACPFIGAVHAAPRSHLRRVVLGRVEGILALPQTALHALPRSACAVLAFQAQATHAETVVATPLPKSILHFTDARSAQRPEGMNSFSIASQSIGSPRKTCKKRLTPFRSF